MSTNRNELTRGRGGSDTSSTETEDRDDTSDEELSDQDSDTSETEAMSSSSTVGGSSTQNELTSGTGDATTGTDSDFDDDDSSTSSGDTGGSIDTGGSFGQSDTVAPDPGDGGGGSNFEGEPDPKTDPSGSTTTPTRDPGPSDGPSSGPENNSNSGSGGSSDATTPTRNGGPESGESNFDRDPDPSGSTTTPTSGADQSGDSAFTGPPERDDRDPFDDAVDDPEPTDDLTPEQREEIRQDIASDSQYDPDDLVVTGVTEIDDGVTADAQLSVDAQREATREAAADQFDEATVLTKIDSDDIVFDGEQPELSAEARARIARNRGAASSNEIDTADVDVTFDEGGEVAEVSVEDSGSEDNSADINAGDIRFDERVARADQERQQEQEPAEPSNEPGAVATAVGNVLQEIDQSPAGTAIDRGSDVLFGDLNDRQDGVVGEIDTFLKGIEDAYETNITEPAEETDAAFFDRLTAGGAASFGVSGETLQDTTVKFAQFSNPGAIGRDLTSLAESGAQAGEFLLDRGPEGVQLAGEIVSEGASSAPGAARGAAEEVAENPRDAATTAAALTATLGAGAAASGVARGGASLAARGARAGARRTDDVVNIARRQSGSLRERAPDVSVRRDADAPALEVDPMLQQQIRNIARRKSNDPGLDSGTSGSLPERIGRFTRQAEINARLNADAATSRVRDAVPTRSSVGGVTPDAGELARQAGRTTRRAEINAVLNADAATSAVRAAVPDSDSISTLRSLDTGDGSLARRAGRRFESERQSLRLSASAAPSAIRSRASDAVPGLNDVVPSRPGSLSFSDSEASLARRAGRRFESERRSLAISAAATPAAVRSRTADAAEGVINRAESAAAAPRNVIPERPSADEFQDTLSSAVPGVPSASSIPRPDQRAASALAGITDTTVRIGPIRPGRTDVKVGDFDLEFDDFDDGVDFGLDDVSGGGASGSGRDALDLDADIDTGGRGSGSGQLSTLRGSRRSGSGTDIDIDADARRRANSGTGLNVNSRDFLAGIGVAGATVFPETGIASDTDPVDEPTVDTGAVEGSSLNVGGTTDLNFDIGLNVGTPTADMTTTDTTVPTDTTSPSETTTPGRPSRMSRPPKTPDFGLDDNDPLDDIFNKEFAVEDSTFDTGVADPDDVLDGLL